MNRVLLLLLAFTFSCASFSQKNSSWNVTYKGDEAFVENIGQFDGRGWSTFDEIQYTLKLGNVFTFFTEKGLTYRFENFKKVQLEGENSQDNKTKRVNQSELINIEFINANADAVIEASELVDYYFSYGLKNYETTKVTSVDNAKGYKKITYKNIYDNIDIEYLLHPIEGIKYNVILHPGANPNDVQFKYTTASKNTDGKTTLNVATNGDLLIQTSLGDITEKAPITFVKGSQKALDSRYVFENGILRFEIDNYVTTEEVIIDPWIISPAFNAGDFTREVETDAVGNIYAIGGELPMVLRKYSPAGALIWQYNTPWDTIGGSWLGTLATDNLGNSYITQGTSSEIQRVSPAGGVVWSQAYSPGGLSTEFWSITFNCNNNKLIVGGTGSVGFFGFRAVVYDINPATGAFNSLTEVNQGMNGFTPIEVRSISSSKNARYVFLTHTEVGAINENFGACPNNEPIYKVPNLSLGYKCENFLSSAQNGGGLKAVVANDNFFYVHNGSQIKQYNVLTGALITTVPLPGGSSATVLGARVVHCSGIAVDAAGNVYAGSMDRVVKFSPGLAVISSINTTGGFTVYDVSVSSNGEVIAGGALLNNSTPTGRGSRIESLNFATPGQYALICCDANICPLAPMCATDGPVTIISNTLGGVWSGPGVNPVTGVFNPAIAGVGTHIITYTLACGFGQISIVVNPCLALEICLESNGSLTASAGNGSYTWSTATITSSSVPITNEAQCIACPSTNPNYFFGIYTGCSGSSCPVIDTVWTQYATGVTTAAPASYPIMVVDGNGVTIIISSQASLVPCAVTTCTPPTLSATAVGVSCLGGSNGSINLTITGTSTYNISWSNLAITEDISGLTAGTYTVTVTDQADPSCFASLNVTVNAGVAGPTAAISGGGAICAGGSANVQVIFTGTPNWSINYTVGGVAQPAISGISTSPQNYAFSTPGTYVLTSVTGASGCPGSVSGSAVITINPTDNASFTLTNFCAGDPNNATITGLAGGTFSFNPVPGGGVTINSSTGEITNGVGGASYTVQYTTNGPCPSSSTQSVSVYIVSNAVQNFTVCTGDNYTYPDGTTSTNIVVAESHTSTLTSAQGCDSIILTNLTIGSGLPATYNYQLCTGSNFTYTDGTVSTNITVNESHVSTMTNPSGCDSIITQNININPEYNLAESLTICENSSVVYPDGFSEVIVANTSHTSNLVTAAGCDSIIVTTVTMGQLYNQVVSATICENGSITYPDGSIATIVANTSQTSTLLSVAGCDSIIVTNVTMSPSFNSVQAITVCTGSNYTYPDGTVSTNITANESHTSTLVSSLGCDSIIVSNITVGASYTATFNYQLCSGDNFTYADGTVSTNITVNESHISTISPPTGCDSIFTENIVVNPDYNLSETLTICENATVTYPDGVSEVIVANTTHTSNLVTAAGCDSIIVSTVTMSPVYNQVVNVTVCENETVVYPDGSSAVIVASTSQSSNLLTAAGCDSTIVTNVTMNPSYNLAEAITVCQNSTVVYPDGTSEVIVANTTHTSSLSTAAGCDSIIVTTVTSTLSLASTVDVTLCAGSNYTYPDGSTSTNIQANESQVSTLTSASGCDSVITTTIAISPAPLADAGEDQTICAGDMATLNATTGPGNAIVWSNGIVNGVAFAPSSTQTYTLTTINSIGCTATDDVTITVTQIPAVVFSGDVLAGCAPLTTVFTNSTSGGPFSNCLWDFGDGTTVIGCGPISHTYSSEGLYSVQLTLTLPGGCVVSGTTANYINVVPDPVASFTANNFGLDVFNSEVSFFNTSTNADNYLWDFGDNSGNVTIENPSHTYPPTDEGYVVTLIASNGFGCSDTATMTIEIEEALIYYVPNSFTPDADEFNNVFKPIFSSGYDPFDYTLLLFNRWGEIIFESHDVDFGWDGTYNGQLVQTGVYTWKIEFKETATDERHAVHGHVNMMR